MQLRHDYIISFGLYNKWDCVKQVLYIGQRVIIEIGLDIGVTIGWGGGSEHYNVTHCSL